MERVRREGVYDIAALAAGGAIQTAAIGLTEPCFGLIRPPGHHASAASSWGFCYFNNMAVALEKLYREKKIGTAFILDFDLHFGDGTVNILGRTGICDDSESNRERTGAPTWRRSGISFLQRRSTSSVFPPGSTTMWRTGAAS